MPTTVVKSIGTASRDYSTLQSWEDACPANLVTADQIWKGECYNDSEFAVAGTILTISGQTTDSTRYVWLTCATGQSFTDNTNKLTNALRYNQANGVAARSTAGFLTDASRFTANYTRIEGIQFAMDYGSHTSGTGPITLDGSNQTVRNCIAFIKSASANNNHCIQADGASNAVVVNCIAVTVQTGGYFSNGVGTGSNTFINVICVSLAGTISGRNAFHRGYGSPTIYDCYGSGWGNFARDGTGTGDYNASDLASPNWPGSSTNCIASLAATNQFTSVSTTTPDLRVKAGAGLINAGNRQNTYTSDLDIVGQTRSTTTPTIGAWEYISAGGNVSVSLSGNSLTSVTGTIKSVISYLLSGNSSSMSTGTVVNAVSQAMGGTSLTTSTGTIKSAVSYTLTGSVATVSTGTITASTGGAVSVNLTGTGLTISQGAVVSAIARTISGNNGTFSTGTIVNTVGPTLAGTTLTTSTGTITSAIARSLFGSSATISTGTLSALSGATITIKAGSWIRYRTI